MAFVVDTDVVSFLFKRDTRSGLYRSQLDGQMLIISFMTLAELERWTIAAQWGDRRHAQLMKYLKRYLVEPSSARLCRRWAEVIESGRQRGRPIGVADAWIAATALEYGVPLVTHNGGDFVNVDDLNVISENRRIGDV